MEHIMNLKGFCILWFVVVLGASGCSSPKPSALRTASAERVRIIVPKTDPASAELAEKMVRKGMRQYEDGLLDSAHRTLEKAVRIDPRNNKGWYYLDRVKQSIYEEERKEQYHRGLGHSTA
jgi:Tfp pilus assembly protein PilF